MKPSGKPPSEELLFEAVELRSAGFGWEAVAEKLHRAVETVRKWPLRYAERWQGRHRQVRDAARRRYPGRVDRCEPRIW